MSDKTVRCTIIKIGGKHIQKDFKTVQGACQWAMHQKSIDCIVIGTGDNDKCS